MLLFTIISVQSSVLLAESNGEEDTLEVYVPGWDTELTYLRDNPKFCHILLNTPVGEEVSVEVYYATFDDGVKDASTDMSAEELLDMVDNLEVVFEDGKIQVVEDVTESMQGLKGTDMDSVDEEYIRQVCARAAEYTASLGDSV